MGFVPLPILRFEKRKQRCQKKTKTSKKDQTSATT